MKKYFPLIISFITLALLSMFVLYTKGSDEFTVNVLTVLVVIVIIAIEIFVIGYCIYLLSKYVNLKNLNND